MEKITPKRNIDTQYDASATAEQYAKGSRENAEKDIGRRYLREKMSELPRTNVVIDIGCGNGMDLQAYKEMGFTDLHGIDPSTKFLEEAKKMLGEKVDVREGSFEKIPYEDAYFDTVVSRFALHYSKNIEASIREVARVLKQGGNFLAIVSHPQADMSEPRDSEGNITITLFKKTVSITFPQHAEAEYFSPEFQKHFSLVDRFEYYGNEQDRGGDGKPNALCFVAIKS